MWNNLPVGMSMHEALNWVSQGEDLERRGDYAGAESCYRYALASAPSHPAVHHHLANLMWREDRLDEAKRHLEELLSHSSQPLASAELAVINGRLALRSRQHQAAYDYFESAAESVARHRPSPELNDILVKACEGMGNAKYRQGQCLTALHYYRRAASVAAGEELLVQLHNLARCLANVGRRSEAARVFRRALKLSDDPGCWRGLADIHFHREKWKSSVECYRRALVREPDDPTTHLGLGQALMMMGDEQAARLHLCRAADLGSIPAESVLRDLDLSAFLGKPRTAHR